MKIYPFVKRIADIICSFFLLLLLSPIFVALTVLVFIKLGWPIFFCQDRPGLNGKIFKIYKFRTMTAEVDHKGAPLSDHERLTGFGQMLRSTSLDELPELINVLKGDMSLVGPRPLLVDYLSRYTELQSHRHDVRPGITGLAQVNGRNAIEWEKVFEYDLQYINHSNPFLDVKILWLTVSKVFQRADIVETGHATRSIFTGSGQSDDS